MLSDSVLLCDVNIYAKQEFVMRRRSDTRPGLVRWELAAMRR
jgi:hypothetical protein